MQSPDLNAPTAEGPKLSRGGGRPWSAAPSGELGIFSSHIRLTSERGAWVNKAAGRRAASCWPGGAKTP